MVLCSSKLFLYIGLTDCNKMLFKCSYTVYRTKLPQTLGMLESLQMSLYTIVQTSPKCVEPELQCYFYILSSNEEYQDCVTAIQLNIFG